MWVAARLAFSFFSGPAGKLLLLVLAFLAWGTYQRVDATSDCEEAELRRELQEAQRQAQIAEEIAEEARIRADQAEADTQKLKELADEVSSQIDTEGRGCAIDPDTRERLLEIR